MVSRMSRVRRWENAIYSCPNSRNLRGALSHTRYAPSRIDACNARATLAGEVEGALACDNRCWIAERELWDLGAYSVSPILPTATRGQSVRVETQCPLGWTVGPPSLWLHC